MTINKGLSTIHFITSKIAWSFCIVLKVFNLRPVWISFVGWLRKYRPQMMINHIIRNMKANNSQNIYRFILFNIFCDSHMYARIIFMYFLINIISFLSLKNTPYATVQLSKKGNQNTNRQRCTKLTQTGDLNICCWVSFTKLSWNRVQQQQKRNSTFKLLYISLPPFWELLWPF